MDDGSMLAALTARELEVLRRIGEGESTRQIARGLRISPATVYTHVRSVFQKLGVRTRGQAAALVAGQPNLRNPRPSQRDVLAPPPTPFDALTRREIEVLRCMAAGLPHVAIAERLILSPNTVRTHVRSVLAKLGVSSALAAGALMRRVMSAPGC
jgi:DNA-binding CsgD family transcriptional regulator